MALDWVDFREIKQSVSIEALLTRYGVELLKAGPGHLRGRCPLPTHSSDRSRFSFGVKTATGAWSCLSASCVHARGGRCGGNVLDLVAILEGCSVREAALRIQESLGSQLVAEERCFMNGAAGGHTNRSLGFALRGLDPGHPYLAGRGIHRDTAEFFGLGYYSAPGLMKGRIAIPLHDETGTLVAYAGRAVGDARRRYLLPARFRKSLVLFNLHRVLKAGGDQVILVEGYFATIWLHQSGLPQTVAMMGTMLSTAQRELLRRHFRKVVLLLDGDAAGRQASACMEFELARTELEVEVVSLPSGTQPDDLLPEHLRNLLHQS